MIKTGYAFTSQEREKDWERYLSYLIDNEPELYLDISLEYFINIRLLPGPLNPILKELANELS